MEKLWTIGHSTRSIEEFTQLLLANHIRLLVDLRSFPRSRRFPHFNQQFLAAALANLGVAYQHFPELGGRRKPRADSPHVVWRNPAFRGYADHMDSDEFRRGIGRLQELACKYGNTAVMCAEAVWWRCHRRLIADYLTCRGVQVFHIIDDRKLQLHVATSGI